MIALDEDVAPEPEAAEIDCELPRVCDRVQVRGVDRCEALVNFEESPASRGLEERHTENCYVREIERRRAYPQRSREETAEVLDVPANQFSSLASCCITRVRRARTEPHDTRHDRYHRHDTSCENERQRLPITHFSI